MPGIITSRTTRSGIVGRGTPRGRTTVTAARHLVTRVLEPQDDEDPDVGVVVSHQIPPTPRPTAPPSPLPWSRGA